MYVFVYYLAIVGMPFPPLLAACLDTEGPIKNEQAGRLVEAID